MTDKKQVNNDSNNKRVDRMLKLYEIPGKTVVTAHRGFSGKFPENTLTAFEKAVELGVDFVEFDVRETADHVPVIMHDELIDRTTNGTGPVTQLTLAELKTLDASYWQGTHNAGVRLEEPLAPGTTVPTLQEVFEAFAGKVFMNIQVYVDNIPAYEKIVELYQQYNLQNQAFLMVATFDVAGEFRKLMPEIELCVGEQRDLPEKHHDFGNHFIQPFRHLVTRDYVKRIEKLGLCANLFFSNTRDDNEAFLATGIKGIMTDNPHLLMSK